SDIIFIFLNYQASLKTLNKEMEGWAQQAKNIFEITLDAKATSMQQLATFIANDPRVATLFNEGKIAVASEGGGPGKKESSIIRERLFKIVNPSWENMSRLYDARQLQFHLGPGSTSFLRVHRPDKFGDNMDDVRHTIVDANVKLKPTKGFETGRVYSGIRGVTPVFIRNALTADKEHVGALETGTSFTVLLNSLHSNLGCEFGILLAKNHVEKNMWADFVKNHFTPDLVIDDFFIEASTNNDIKEILSIQTVSSLLNSEGSLFIKGDKPLQVCIFPLRDYRGSIDKQLPQSGVVVVWKDASKRWETFTKNLVYNIIYAVLALLVVEGILFITWKYSRNKLQSIIDGKIKELSESKQRLEALIENIPTGVLTVDAISKKIIGINPQASKMIDGLPASVVGRRYTEFLLETEPSVDVENNNQIEQNPSDCMLLSLNNDKIPVLKASIETIINEQKVLIICLSDLTKQKEAENELIRREKLQGVLEMTGAICHEINQPLMVLSGYSELLLNDTSESKQEYKSIKAIFDQSQRISTITKKLMKITQYKTKDYLKGKIIDIDAASDENKTDTD
ncbi:MAG: hypothetical protein KAJ62_11750, partial [Desulfobacteraceae bacterium]|nr:hypothetical protein [Desulfobacteraceae bacterium]